MEVADKGTDIAGGWGVGVGGEVDLRVLRCLRGVAAAVCNALLRCCLRRWPFSAGARLQPVPPAVCGGAPVAVGLAAACVLELPQVIAQVGIPQRPAEYEVSSCCSENSI